MINIFVDSNVSFFNKIKSLKYIIIISEFSIL